MTRQVHFDGKTYSFPEGVTDAEIGVTLTNIDHKTSFADFYLEAGLFLLLIVLGYFIVRKLTKNQFAVLYSASKKLSIVALIFLVIWMFRYEVTPTHPHQCLDRWIGQVVNC